MHAVCVVLTSFAVMQCTQHTHTKTSHIHAYTHTPREGQIADGYRANDCELCVCELMKPAFSFHSFQISVAGGKGTLGARGRFPNNNFFLCKVSDKTLECCTYLEGTTSLSINAWFRSCIFQVHRLLVQWTHRARTHWTNSALTLSDPRQSLVLCVFIFYFIFLFFKDGWVHRRHAHTRDTATADPTRTSHTIFASVIFPKQILMQVRLSSGRQEAGWTKHDGNGEDIYSRVSSEDKYHQRVAW